MSRKTASLKVDLDIHKKILWFRDRKLITVSISEFVNSTLREKLDTIGHGETDRILREKLDEVIVRLHRILVNEYDYEISWNSKKQEYIWIADIKQEQLI